MNRIYRLVWNRALGVVQVATEFARAPRGGQGSARAGATPRRNALVQACALALMIGASAPALAANTYTVTSSTDDGSGANGTLSWAINQANGDPGSTIDFGSITSVSESGTLPALTQATTFTGAGDVSIGGAMTGSGRMNWSGTGTLTLAGSGTSLNGGVYSTGGLVVGTNTSSVQINGAASGYGVGLSGAGSLNVASSSSIQGGNSTIGGGAGVSTFSSSGTTQVTNAGTIQGGNGMGVETGFTGVRGGYGLYGEGAFSATNSGTISGGAGGTGGQFTSTAAGSTNGATGGAGGTAVDGSGSYLNNSNQVLGGAGGGGGAAGAYYNVDIQASFGGRGGDGGAGGGGFYGQNNSYALNTGTIRGGAGGAGAAGGDALSFGESYYGNGGDSAFAGSGGYGGQGGMGAIVAFGSYLDNHNAVSGGNGGVGGQGGSAYTYGEAGYANGGSGGRGGDGGIGAGVGMAYMSNSNAGTIRGGAGGVGGAGGRGYAYDSYGYGGQGGYGGYGGAGVQGQFFGLLNQGTIAGGAGGVGGYGGTAYGYYQGYDGTGGRGGFGGAGVDAYNGSIYNLGGTIRGGKGGAGGGAENAVGGIGGHGGMGMVGQGFYLMNTGTVAGGDGGDGGSGSTQGAGGYGGAGVVSYGHSDIINAGNITGGYAGAGAGYAGGGIGPAALGNLQADAIDFYGGSNTLELRAGYHFTGNVISFSGGSDTLILGGDGNSSFNLSQVVGAMPTTYSGSPVYYGFGAYEKTGTSTWTLYGSNADTETWTVSDGKLEVGDVEDAGTVLTGSVTVNGGALGGHGTITGDVTNTAGIVQPGGSVGILTVGGNYVQGAGGTLVLEITPDATPGTGSSQLLVGGSATLDGGLGILMDPGTYLKKTYTLVHADGGVSGTFATVDFAPGLGQYMTGKVSYTANDVLLDLTPTGNAYSTGYANYAGAVSLGTEQTFTTVLGRLGPTADGRQGAWGQFMVGRGGLGQGRYQFNGTAAGYGHALSNDFVVGVAVAGATTTSSLSPTQVRAKPIGGFVYGIVRTGDWRLSGSMGSGWLSQSSKRFLGGVDSYQEATSHGHYFGAALRAEYTAKLGAWNLTPYGGLDTINARYGAAQEQGMSLLALQLRQDQPAPEPLRAGREAGPLVGRVAAVGAAGHGRLARGPRDHGDRDAGRLQQPGDQRSVADERTERWRGPDLAQGRAGHHGVVARRMGHGVPRQRRHAAGALPLVSASVSATEKARRCAGLFVCRAGRVSRGRRCPGPAAGSARGWRGA